MQAYESNQISRAFKTAYNSGQVANLLALYEPSARLVQACRQTRAVMTRISDDDIATGLSQIEQELTNLLRLGGQINCDCQYAIEFGKITLVRANWVISTVDVENQPQVIVGHSTEIVRRQPDGRWLYVIDHPFGANA